MSLLQDVIEQYGDFESVRSPTDKTDKRGSVSFGSEWSELLENINGELEEHQVPIAADMVAIIEMRERGIVPDHYTSETECKHCGPVPIFPGCPPQVDGCPWCFNRLRGLPMPEVVNEMKAMK